jgi:sentrin-specific protease 1
MHWSLVVVDLHNKVMSYYDSLKWDGSEYMRVLTPLFEYLVRGERLSNTLSTIQQNDNLGSEYTGSVNSQNEWEYRNIKNIPKQENSWDCGVYLCKYMEYISRNEEINFSQEDMNYFRIQIAHELLEGGL